MLAEMEATRQQQAQDDQLGIKAAGTTLPGALRAVWAAVPDIEEGPYKVRRFVDADFVRLCQLGHPLDSFGAMQKWMENPTITGPDAYNIIWLMTTDVFMVKQAIASGVDKVKEAATEKFSELQGLELAVLIRAIATQLARYMGAKLEYAPLPTEGQAGPPPLSQPPVTV